MIVTPFTFFCSPTYSLFHFQVSIYWLFFDDPKSFIRIAHRVLTATSGYTTEENLSSSPRAFEVPYLFKEVGSLMIPTLELPLSAIGPERVPFNPFSSYDRMLTAPILCGSYASNRDHVSSKARQLGHVLRQHSLSLFPTLLLLHCLCAFFQDVP